MTVLDEVTADMSRLGYMINFMQIDDLTWRLSFLRGDYSQPAGYYKNFSYEKKDDHEYIVQWLLIMYLEIADDRAKNKKSKYTQIKDLPQLQ